MESWKMLLMKLCLIKKRGEKKSKEGHVTCNMDQYLFLRDIEPII
jgi:hypothetical protein